MTGFTIEVLAVGNELLAGDILDTDFGAIAREIRDAGGEIARHLTVGDDRARIAAEVAGALTRASLVIVTGGLGPTADDLTRFGVSDALGRPLVKDEGVVTGLRERFRRYGITDMPPANEVQALFPEGSEVLDNPNGTAPGFRCRTKDGSRTVMVLPGPPRELEPMLGPHVVAWLRANATLPVVHVRRLRTIGIGESLLAERISDWPFGLEGLDLGYYPQDPGVDLKITARGADRKAVEALAERAVGRLRELLGVHVYGEERVPLPQVLGQLLRAAGRTLAVAESCTGGLIGALVTSTPGSSDYFDGGVVTYSNAAKEALLGVPHENIATHGAVSEEVARSMAESVRSRRGTDYGLAVTGIAGPDGGTPDKPVGLVWIGLAGPFGTVTLRTHHAGERTTIQRRAAMTALDHLRRELIREKTEGRNAG